MNSSTLLLTTIKLHMMWHVYTIRSYWHQRDSLKVSVDLSQTAKSKHQKGSCFCVYKVDKSERFDMISPPPFYCQRNPANLKVFSLLFSWLATVSDCFGWRPCGILFSARTCCSLPEPRVLLLPALVDNWTPAKVRALAGVRFRHLRKPLPPSHITSGYLGF